MASAHGGHSGGLRISTSAEAGAASSAIASANQLAFNVTKSDVGTWTGGDVWESAVCLAQYLRGIGLDWGATRVVELGAGAGLVGLTAAACGAREVVLTDQVLHLAAHNANQNFSGAARERVQLQELRWGDADMTASVCGGGDGFDLIVASDVIYYNEHVRTHAHLPSHPAHPFIFDRRPFALTSELWVGGRGSMMHSLKRWQR